MPKTDLPKVGYARWFDGRKPTATTKRPGVGPYSEGGSYYPKRAGTGTKASTTALGKVMGRRPYVKTSKTAPSSGQKLGG